MYCGYSCGLHTVIDGHRWWIGSLDTNNGRFPAKENADRVVACVNALAGLTPEQVSAVPRLVAWFLDNDRWDVSQSELEESSLLAIYAKPEAHPSINL